MRKVFSIRLVFLFCSFISITQVFASTYFVSRSGNDLSQGTSTSAAWETLAKVQDAANKGLLKAGDTVLFRRGDEFTGTLKWTTIWGQNCASGTPSQPIRFAAYGTGPKPVFHYPSSMKEKAENRIVMLFAGVDYIEIEGLAFIESLPQETAKIAASNCAVPLYFGAMDEATSNHCSIRDVTISGCGNGIVLIGNFNKISNSNLSNFGNIRNSFKTTEGTQYDDYGANAITITGDDNVITENYISGAWAESEDFGWNGGAFEMFNHCNRNRISHNTIIDCGGVAEFGAQRKGAFAHDNVFAYNKIINCGGLSWCNIEGVFSIDVSRVTYLSNTIIENIDSRFSGPNTGNGILSPSVKKLVQPEKVLFAFNGQPNAEVVYELQKNVFSIHNALSVISPGANQAKFNHSGNVYHLTGGAEINFKLDATEVETNKPLFGKLTGNPVEWDLQLKNQSYALDAGAAVSFHAPFVYAAYQSALATWLYTFFTSFKYRHPNVSVKQLNKQSIWMHQFYSWLWS